MKSVLVTTEAKWDRLRRYLENRTVCGFDTEAVGPRRRYSKANQNAFLNVSLSSLQGASWGFEDEVGFYIPLRHKGPNGKFSWFDEALALTAKMQEVWCHNVKFDSRMLHQDGYDCSDWNWRDSMLVCWMYHSRSAGIGLKKMAKDHLDRESPPWEGSLIDKSADQVLEYVCHDAVNCLQIGQKLEAELPAKLAQWNREVDTPIADILGRMEMHGIPLNLEKLEETMGTVADEALQKSTARWNKLTAVQDPETQEWAFLNPGSMKHLQEFFTDGTWKPRGATSSGLLKTGRDVMEYNEKQAQTAAGRELATLCLELREAKKVRGTYLDGFYEELRQWPDRRLHPELNQTGTRTTRFSSANPNIQNQLAHGEYAPMLRECYEAPEGWVYIAADYSQQEPRIFAQLAGPGALQDIFKDGKDLHQEMADAIEGTRDQGKTFNMGFLLYGGSAMKAAREFGWSKQEAQEKIDAAFARFPESPALRRRVIGVAEQREPWPFVRVKSGHRRWVPELVPNKWQREDPEAFEAKCQSLSKKYNIPRNNLLRLCSAIRSSGERIALNTIIQGSGAAMAKKGMVVFDDLVRHGGAVDPEGVRLVTMTHDELTVLAREGEAPKTADILKYSMEAAAIRLGYTIPFPVEPKVGKDWSELK